MDGSGAPAVYGRVNVLGAALSRQSVTGVCCPPVTALRAGAAMYNARFGGGSSSSMNSVAPADMTAAETDPTKERRVTFILGWPREDQAGDHGGQRVGP